MMIGMQERSVKSLPVETAGLASRTIVSVPAASDRTYRGQTGEARAADRRQQLIDAAVELLGTDGASGVTMRAAARVAGLSPRFFYESFADRDELMMAAYDATLARLRSTALGAITRTGSIRDGMDAAAALVQDEPRVGRILFRESLSGGALREHAQRQIYGFYATALDEVGILPATAPDALFRVNALAGALIYLFIEWADGNLGSDRVAFVDYCTRVIQQLLA
jgi:AcrR family transcriptional regulator